MRQVNLWWMSAEPLAEYQTTFAESDLAMHWQWADRQRLTRYHTQRLAALGDAVTLTKSAA